MFTIRKSEDRGHANHGWLKAKHSFSFSSYFDRNHMGFRSLRVINQDIIAGGEGFPTHPHDNMEILTYIIDGAIEHRDTIGSHGVIRPGEIQYMSAGTGIQHSEFNHLKDKPTHLLQIWIHPNVKGGASRYGQINFSEKFKNQSLVLVASSDGRDQSIQIKQDVSLWVGKMKKEETIQFPLKKDRFGWIQLVKGKLNVNGQLLNEGDGLAIAEEEQLHILSETEAEFLCFDLN